MTTSAPRPVRLALLACAAALWIACEPADRPTPITTAEIDTLPSGVIRVENSGEEAWNEAERWRLVPVDSIGPARGAVADAFGVVGPLTLDELGRSWIYDRQSAELRVFDVDGAYVRTVSRPGEGLGTFLDVTALLWSPDQRLWAVDPRADRISVFDSAGVYLTAYPLPGRSYRPQWPGAIDAQGNVYVVEEDFVEGWTWLIRTAEPADQERGRLVPLDTLSVPPHPVRPEVYSHESEGGPTVSTAIPFAGTVEWSVARDGGLWAAVTDRYELVRLDPAGDTVRLVTHPFTPVPLTPDEREMAGEFVPAEVIPDHHEVIDRILLDDDENLWVLRTGPGEGAGRLVDVFDGNGVYLGRLDSPVPIRAGVALRDGVLLVVTTDTVGVPYVVRLEVVKGNG